VRLVLDTNVLLAAFGTHGLCEALFATCLEGHELVTSEHILGELRRNLTRAFRMSARQANEVVEFVREHSRVVSPARVPTGTCGDPHDLPVIGTAVTGLADLLVTGDKDLLESEGHGGILIVTPRECYAHLTGSTKR
jgi:uncharacterized protein